MMGNNKKNMKLIVKLNDLWHELENLLIFAIIYGGN